MRAGLLTSTRYQHVVLADGPTSYWRLADPSGTTAVDEKGAHNGTYVNTPTLGAAGRMAGNAAVTFTRASSEYVATGDLSLVEAGDCTYELWMKTPTAAGTTLNMFGENGAGNGLAGLQVDNSGNQPRLILRNDAGTFVQRTGTTNVLDNAWHYVAMTKTATVAKLYVNGVQEGADLAHSGTYTINTSTIGAILGGDFFNGSIDEVAVYPSALSAARVLAHYKSAS